MFLVFILGTAGSGKSLLTSVFSKWLRVAKQDVATVNLDPGVMTLPYNPDFDIRDYINITKLMEDYRLGPNGALVVAADLIAEQVDTLGSAIEDMNADIVLVDTPGQIELFAFRASGPFIAKELTTELKAIIYLFDSIFSLDPVNYVSNLFLSAAVYNRFLLPQIHVLSKSDLLPEKKVESILEWSNNPEALESEIEAKIKGTKRLLSRDLIQSISRLGLSFPMVQASSKTNDGFLNLNGILERILSGGEKFTS
jgi:GTPase SAR1 family protein